MQIEVSKLTSLREKRIVKSSVRLRSYIYDELTNTCADGTIEEIEARLGQVCDYVADLAEILVSKGVLTLEDVDPGKGYHTLAQIEDTDSQSS